MIWPAVCGVMIFGVWMLDASVTPARTSDTRQPDDSDRHASRTAKPRQTPQQEPSYEWVEIVARLPVM